MWCFFVCLFDPMNCSDHNCITWSFHFGYCPQLSLISSQLSAPGYFSPLTVVSSGNLHDYHVIFFSFQGSTWPPLSFLCTPVLSQAWVMVLYQTMIPLSERSGIPPVPADLVSSLSGCFPRRSRNQTRMRVCRTRECHPTSRSGGALSHSKQTVLNVNTWPPGNRPQASTLGKWQKLILFSKLLLFFISCCDIMADFTFLAKLEHSTGFLSSSLATHVQCTALN